MPPLVPPLLPQLLRPQQHRRHRSPPFIYDTPKHTLWVFGRSITPPGSSQPPWAPCELHHPGLSHPPQDTTPGDNISKSQNVITGVCYLASVTVVVQRLARGRPVSVNSALSCNTRRRCARGRSCLRSLGQTFFFFFHPPADGEK